MPNSFRQNLQFYLINCKTPLGKIIDIFIILLNLSVCVIFVIETYVVSEVTKQWLWRSEIIIVFFFIIEYGARLYGAKSRLKQLTDIYSIFDLIAIFPTITMLIFSLFGISLDLDFIN